MVKYLFIKMCFLSWIRYASAIQEKQADCAAKGIDYVSNATSVSDFEEDSDYSDDDDEDSYIDEAEDSEMESDSEEEMDAVHSAQSIRGRGQTWRNRATLDALPEYVDQEEIKENERDTSFNNTSTAGFIMGRCTARDPGQEDNSYLGDQTKLFDKSIINESFEGGDGDEKSGMQKVIAKSVDILRQQTSYPNAPFLDGNEQA